MVRVVETHSTKSWYLADMFLGTVRSRLTCSLRERGIVSYADISVAVVRNNEVLY